MSHYLLAQQATLSGGGDISTSSGSVSFSIGQLSYSNLTGKDHYILEGVQQPYELFVTSVEESGDPGIEIIVFPNPTQGTLRIRTASPSDKWTFRLTNIQGQLIQKGSIDQPQHALSIHSLPSSTYLLELWNGNAHKKTFKIIKSDVQ